METFKILWSSDSWRQSICITLIAITVGGLSNRSIVFCALFAMYIANVCCAIMDYWHCYDVEFYGGLRTLLQQSDWVFIRWLFDNKIHLMVEQKIICFTDICLIYSTLSQGRSYVIKMKDNEKKATWCTWCDTWPLRIWREKLVRKFASRIFLKVRVWNTVVCIWNYCAKNEHWRCRESQRRCQGLLW